MIKKLIVLLFFASISLIAAEVNWEKDFYSALKVSKKENKPVMFVFSRHSCRFCEILDNTTFKDQKVIETLNKDFISVISYTDEGDYTPRYLWRPGTPAIWFLLPSGEPMYQALMGAIGPKRFVVALEKVQKEFEKISKK